MGSPPLNVLALRTGGIACSAASLRADERPSVGKNKLMYLLLGAAAIYLGARYLRSRPDALTQAAQLQAQGKPVPLALKQQVAAEHLKDAP